MLGHQRDRRHRPDHGINVGSRRWATLECLQRPGAPLALGPRGECARQHPGSRTDLDHAVTGLDSGAVDEQSGNAVIDEKVLPQVLAGH